MARRRVPPSSTRARTAASTSSATIRSGLDCASGPSCASSAVSAPWAAVGRSAVDGPSGSPSGPTTWKFCPSTVRTPAFTAMVSMARAAAGELGLPAVASSRVRLVTVPAVIPSLASKPSSIRTGPGGAAFSVLSWTPASGRCAARPEPGTAGSGCLDQAMASGPGENELEHYGIGEQVVGPVREDPCPVVCRLLVGASVERHLRAFEVGDRWRLLQFPEVAVGPGVHGVDGH